MAVPVVTIYIPFAEYHASIVHRAITSAEQQTFSCNVLSSPSPQTPSQFRNQALNATTPFVCFLDADDTIAPTFIEECLRAYQTGRYVYTSWFCGDVLRQPNLCVTKDKDYRSHLITTLYPTAAFKALGGFDEALVGHEDVDFYLRSARAGVCGLHLDKPLLYYTDHGQRSNLFNQRTDKKAIMDDVFLRTGGQRTIMACCGTPGTQAVIHPGEAQPGDVQAVTLWAGMHSEVGLVTGRVYNGGNQVIINIDPRDIAQRPDLFRAVQDTRNLAPKRETVLREAGLV